MIKYNRLLLQNTVEEYEDLFKSIKSILYSLYYDPRVTAANVKLALQRMDRIDYMKEGQIVNQIENHVSNSALNLDNILIYFNTSSLILDKGGRSDAEAAFAGDYNSLGYPFSFWQKQFNERYTYRTFPKSEFSLVPGFTKSLMPISIKETPKYQIIALLDADRMLQTFHNVPDAEFMIMDSDRQTIFQTSEHFPESALSRVEGKEGEIEWGRHYYFLQKGNETGFTYVTMIPTSIVTSQMEKFNLTLLLALGLSIGVGIICSHFFSRRLHRPVKQIIASVQHSQQGSLGSTISEFNLIHDKIHSLIKEKDDIQAELVNQKSLLTNYGYINKLKMIRSDLSDLQEFIRAHRKFRIVLYHLQYRHTSLQQLSRSPDEVSYYLREYINLTISESFPGSHTFQIESNQILSILFEDEPGEDLQETLALLKKVWDGDAEYYLISVAISSIYTSAAEFSSAYDEVLEMAAQAELLAETQIITELRQLDKHHPFILEREKEFELNLREGNDLECREILNRMLDYLQQKGESAARIKQFAKSMLERMIHLASSINSDQDLSELQKAWRQTKECFSMEQLKQLLEPQAARVASLFRSVKNEQNDLANRASDILEMRYAEDISLDSVADCLNISSNYLSILMKEKTGINFSEHLNNIRIRKAKELLESTSLSVQEVGIRIGYRNVTSFIRMFKKITGLTPGDYRKQNKLESLR
ncbi:hypothetical protein J2TS4_25890 [Paenibacillus sp. J2TS4]|nr:hypothetical protein J2TS4_25890 [Paenibacillus sp. J2TS4]